MFMELFGLARRADARRGRKKCSETYLGAGLPPKQCKECSPTYRDPRLPTLTPAAPFAALSFGRDRHDDSPVLLKTCELRQHVERNRLWR